MADRYFQNDSGAVDLAEVIAIVKEVTRVEFTLRNSATVKFYANFNEVSDAWDEWREENNGKGYSVFQR